MITPGMEAQLNYFFFLNDPPPPDISPLPLPDAFPICAAIRRAAVGQSRHPLIHCPSPASQRSRMIAAAVLSMSPRRMRRLRPPLARRALSAAPASTRSEEHTSELQSPCNLVCRLLLEK